MIPKINADQAWETRRSFFRSMRSASTPPHKPNIILGTTLTRFTVPSCRADPVNSNVNQFRTTCSVHIVAAWHTWPNHKSLKFRYLSDTKVRRSPSFTTVLGPGIALEFDPLMLPTLRQFALKNCLNTLGHPPIHYLYAKSFQEVSHP